MVPYYYQPSNSTIWTTTTASSSTSTMTYPIYISTGSLWLSNNTATGSILGTVYWVDDQSTYWPQQLAQAPQRYVDRFAAPHVVSRERIAELERREAEREQQLYQQALRDHDQQEAERIHRLIEARREAERAQREAFELRTRADEERRRQREAAHIRSRELLLEHLTPEQRHTFEHNGWFVVEGGRSRTRYRIRGNSISANIDVLDQRERVTHRLCAHGRYEDSLPHGDHILAQKIMLELAEDDFLRIANRHMA